MTTRRVLCGWVNFNERVASHDALQAMLGAEGLSLGDPLEGFQGILRGVPNFVGPGSGLMGEASA